MHHHMFRWLLPLPLYRQLLPIVGVMLLYSAIVFFIEKKTGYYPNDWGHGGSMASGIILGLLLVVHTNTANARWWEGRSLWGTLINTSRNLALKTRDLVQSDEHDRGQMARMLTGFAHSLRMQLRDGVRLNEVPGFQLETNDPLHVPLWFSDQVYAIIGQWHKSGKVDGDLLRVLDQNAAVLMDVCGACERIRFTPLPLSFRALLRHGIVLYLALAPIYVVSSLGFWSVPTIGAVTYFLVGTELLAEDVEEPFGIGPDNLDLDGYCRTIENSMRQVLG